MSQGSIRQALEESQALKQNVIELPGASENNWPELKPLTRAIPPAPDFPVQALGPILSAAALKIQAAVKAPLAICGQSILAAANLAVQPLADVEIDGRIIPISNFYLTLGESGERKSGVDRWALRAHIAHERNRKAEFDKAERNYQKLKRLHEEKRRAITRKRSLTTEQLEKELEALGPEPEAPLQPYILLTDPTMEGLFKLFQNGQASLGLFSDEGGKFLGSYSMSSDHQVAAISSLSSLWDGSPVDRVRGGDGFTKLYGRRLSVHLLVQPRIAGSLLSNSVAQEQGILARFLISYPDSTAGSRSYEETDLSTDPDLIRFWTRCRRCLETPLLLVEGLRNELRPRTIGLTVEAKALWITFHDAVEFELKADGKYTDIKAFACKAPEHCLRLAAVLCLFENPEANQIQTEHIDAAMNLIDFYIQENVRLSSMGASGADDVYESCQRLADWLNKPGRSQLISLVEIYRTGPNFIRSAQKARKLLKILVLHGYVRRVISPVEFEGKPRTETFEIRPLNSS